MKEGSFDGAQDESDNKKYNLMANHRNNSHRGF
jgi:hypothetical protein